MKTAYIFHDAFCDAHSDWYQWLKTTLEPMGYFVVIPNFPTPAGQSYESWKAVIKNYFDKFDNETIFVGHGIGGTFALRILEESSTQIRGLFLVASYAEKLGHVGYNRVNDSFIHHTFDWNKIKNNTSVIKFFVGQNDPFVPMQISENLAKNLGVELENIPDGGHINKASGFVQCIPLVQGIKEGLRAIDKSMVLEHPLPADVEVPDVANLVRPADAAFHSDTIVNEESAPTGEKKFATEAPAGTHTMYQDMTKLVNSNEGRVATSLLGKARAEEEEKKLNEPLTKTNSIYIIGTFAVFLVIVGIGTWFFTRYLPAQKNIPAQTTPSLIQSESHNNINISGKQSYEVARDITNTLNLKPQADTLADIYYTKGSLRASFNDVLDSLDLSDDVPQSLITEFLPAGVTNIPVFMHGSSVLQGKDAHALIVPITHYDRAFSGFHEWEPTMLKDLGIFMNIPESVLKTKVTKDVFQDEMILNKNIRTLRLNKEFVLGYFFLNDHTVIIIDNLAIIPELLTRYANSQIYR